MTCPWHAYRFSLLDGTSPEDEDHEALTLPVRVQDGGIQVDLGGEWRMTGDVVWIPACSSVPPPTQEEHVSQDKTLKMDLEGDLLEGGLEGLRLEEVRGVTLVDSAISILQVADPTRKVKLTHQLYQDWTSGLIQEVLLFVWCISLCSYSNREHAHVLRWVWEWHRTDRPARLTCSFKIRLKWANEEVVAQWYVKFFFSISDLRSEILERGIFFLREQISIHKRGYM